MVMAQARNAIGADWTDVAGGGLQRVRDDRFVQRTIFTAPGRYRLTLRLGGDRSASFSVRVASPSGPRITLPNPRVSVRTGEPVDLRFRVEGADPTTTGVLAYGTGSGGRLIQLRAAGRRTGPGRYAATLVFRSSGRYRVTLTSEQVALPSAPAIDVRVVGAS